jgi:plasminogen activator inhibitor 1 RNA-binding protein
MFPTLLLLSTLKAGFDAICCVTQLSNTFCERDSDVPLCISFRTRTTATQITTVHYYYRKNDDRNTKGGGRGRPAPTRDGKRQYDRRSGTGRGKEIKKSGGGGRNWGSDKDAAKKAEGPVTEGAEDANTPEAEDKVETVEEEEVAEEKEPEPVDNTISYDEYVATKAKPDSALFKPVETREVDNEFAGKAAAKKEEVDFLVMGGGKQLKKKGTKKEKQTLVLDFKVKNAISDDRRREERRDGGGRRDGGSGRRDGGSGRRDGDRPRGARGGGRGGKVDPNDASAFPSL